MNDSNKPSKAAPKKSTETPAQGGLEKSADQDDKSNQKPGVHGSDVEKRIGQNMPDRK